jgi:hypothetical protein
MPFDPTTAKPVDAPKTSGFDPSTAKPVDVPPKTGRQQAIDEARSIGSGLRVGTEGLIGMGGDVPNMIGAGVEKVLPWVGASPEQAKTAADWTKTGVQSVTNPGAGLVSAGSRIYSAITGKDAPIADTGPPTSADVRKVTEPVIGAPYQPQTKTGEYAHTIASFAPSLVFPAAEGENIVNRIGTQVLLPGVTSETGGQLTKGTPYEAVARFIGGLTGGLRPGEGAGPEAAAQRATAEQAVRDAADFGITNLTRGEATGNVAQQQIEQQFLHGARGPVPQLRMIANQQLREQSRQAANEALTGRIGPGGGADAFDAANRMKAVATGFAQHQMDAGATLIDGALHDGVWIDSAHLNHAPDYVNSRLAGNTPGVPEYPVNANTPVAAQALGHINDFVASMPPNVREVSLAGAEQLRRLIGGLQASTPNDARALRAVSRFYDQWMDEAINNHVTRVGGDPGTLPNPAARNPQDVMDQLRTGRDLYRQGAELVRPRTSVTRNEPGGIPGGAAVANILTEATTPEQIARSLAPNQRGIMPPQAPQILARLIDKFGTDSEVVNHARNMVVNNLLQGGPQQTAGNIERFFTNSPTSAERLFRPDQIDQIQRYGNVNRSLVPAPQATNPSRSSYGPLAALQSAGFGGGGATIGGTIGAATGIPGARTVGAVAGGFGGNLLKNIKNARDVRRALEAVPNESSIGYGPTRAALAALLSQRGR